MCSFIGHIPAASIASATGECSHSLSSDLQYLIPAIRQEDMWGNPSSKFNVSPVITQLSLPYISTVCATGLYRIPLACTIASVFVGTLDITPHRCRAFCMLWLTAALSLSLYMMVRTRYIKAYAGYSSSIFPWIENRLASNKYSSPVYSVVWNHSGSPE